jgi:RimJ/RimL family protein N-acetyltransferase
MLAVELFCGSRSELLPLFLEADDSLTEITSYMELGEVLVVRDEGRIIGHVQLIQYASDWEIRSIAVIESKRGQGVGSALAHVAVDRAFRSGGARVRVRTATADIGNLRFYQRVGFRMERVDRDVFSIERGYSMCEIDGIPLLDQIWFSITASDHADFLRRRRNRIHV